MEEIEIMSWLTLDAIKKKAKVVETVGNLQTGHSMSVFGIIEEDYLELCLQRLGGQLPCGGYEDRDEFDVALEDRKGRGRRGALTKRTTTTTTKRRGRGRGTRSSTSRTSRRAPDRCVPGFPDLFFQRRSDN